MRPTRPRSRRVEERGFTLVSTLLLLFGLLTLAIAGLHGARSDLQVSRNYTSAVQALLSAENGLLHAQKVIDNNGVVSFYSDVVAEWSSLFGSGSRTVSGRSDLSYTVAPEADAIDPLDYVILESTGRTGDGAERTIRARLTQDGVFSPGAIYLPDPSVSTSFSGNAFLIDGSDTNLDGTSNPSGDVAGIGTSTTTAADNVEASLEGTQLDNVIGAGGTPSVSQTDGPTSERITDTIVPNILTEPGVVTNPVLTGVDTFGTLLTPQVTHFTGNVSITGALTGAGILIVDQGLTVSGSVSFTGLIIVRGTTQITSVLGSATILGAIWTTDLTLSVAGSASITYSSQALALADALGGGSLLPQRVRVVAWSEV